jgi:hypothetical protein
LIKPLWQLQGFINQPAIFWCENVQSSNPPLDGIFGDADPEDLEGLLPIGESF